MNGGASHASDDAFLAGMLYLRDEIIRRQPSRTQYADTWRAIAEEVIDEYKDEQTGR